MENLNFHSTAKLNSREICSNAWTAKFNSTKMQKFCLFCEPRNFLPTKISDNKILFVMAHLVCLNSHWNCKRNISNFYYFYLFVFYGNQVFRKSNSSIFFLVVLLCLKNHRYFHLYQHYWKIISRFNVDRHFICWSKLSEVSCCYFLLLLLRTNW